MKKIIIMSTICLLCVISGFSQSRKTMNLLYEGIQSNDFIKINQAIKKGAVFNSDDLTQAIQANNLDLAKFIVGKGVTFDDGLCEAIVQKNFDLIEYYVSGGANPSSGLETAVKENNLVYVNYLLEKGAKFVDSKTYDFVGQTYFNGTPIKSMFIDGKNYWVYEENNKRLESNTGIYSYQTKAILTNDKSLIYAINNNNPEMIDLILKNGVDVQKPCKVYGFNGMPSNIRINYNPGGLVSERFSLAPMPPTIILPIKYAVYKNADKSIIDVLCKYGAKP